jgi:hypothetical protein
MSWMDFKLRVSVFFQIENIQFPEILFEPHGFHTRIRVKTRDALRVASHAGGSGRLAAGSKASAPFHEQMLTVAWLDFSVARR